jgi:hypothetical protein
MQNIEAKHTTMYEKIEIELRGVQHTLQSNHAIFIVPLPSEEPELGDEPTQLCRIVDATKSHLRRAKEEKEHAMVALKHAQ